MVEGVPVLLCAETPATIGVARESIAASRGRAADDPWHLATLGISDVEREGVREELSKMGGDIDPVVSFLVGATNGNAYRDVIGRLPRLPIPRWPFQPGRGGLLLDLGCNWGRWCLAAASSGFRVIGIDPSLGAVLAGMRTARRLGMEIAYVVGDARALPVAGATVDHVFSYSVLQHFSDHDVAASLDEVRRVSKDEGRSWIQMATRFGLRNLQQQARRRFRDACGFEVRYRSIGALHHEFTRALGPTKIQVDCFFGLGLRDEDRDLMTPLAAHAAAMSARLRNLSRWVPPLRWFADSVFVCSSIAARGSERGKGTASASVVSAGIDDPNGDDHWT